MTNGNTNRLRRRKGFGLLSKDEHKALSSKGGRAKVPKGLAYIKEHDPERHQAIIKKAIEARGHKYTVPGDATKHTEDTGDEVQS